LVNKRTIPFLLRGPVAFSLGWAMTALILFFSLMPGESLPKLSWEAFLGIDKWAHFTCYAWSCFFLFIYYTNYTKVIHAGVYIPVILFFIGGTIELLQGYFKAGRTVDILDQVANTIGILAGTFLAMYAIRKIKTDLL
jgi:VanZ family protein